MSFFDELDSVFSEPPRTSVSHVPMFVGESEHGHRYRYNAATYFLYGAKFDVHVQLWAYPITRSTKASVWVDDHDRERRIGLNWTKQWAAASPELAWRDFKIRLAWRARYAQQEVDRVTAIKAVVEADGA